ncbi:MAG: methylase [Methanocorpusculum sp.]|nr:methylase [Methanocorpusculum sp.]
MSEISEPYDTEQVYLPAEDTYLLRDAVLSAVRSTDYVLEVGTGSGEIAAYAAKVAEHTFACEINPHAARYAKEVNGVDVVRCDLFSAISGSFDLICFNAPYLPTAPGERMDDWLEAALDGGPSGRDTVYRFLEEAPNHLKDGGQILLLISSLTGVEEVISFAEKHGCSAEIFRTETEEDGEELVVLKICKVK